mmetsp:Transcript_3522/g.12288  ORF Transcript_3522/g.12288 Transcript_3522/m.12288 type:complete len:324 (+) Transcript_3522:935-1906(+)
MEAGAGRRVPLSSLLSSLLRSHWHRNPADPHGLLHDHPVHHWHALHRERSRLLHRRRCVRPLLLRGRVRQRAVLRAEQGELVDQDDDVHSLRLQRLLRPRDHVTQPRRRLLQLPGRHPLRHHGDPPPDLAVRLLPPRSLWDDRGEKPRQALPAALTDRADPPADPRQALVPELLHPHPPGWPPSLRQHLHRDVLHLHLLLELQVLLRLRLHPARFLHHAHRYLLRQHRHHLLPPERGRLQVAVDCLLVLGIDFWICFPLRHLLLHGEDEDVRFVSNLLLLRTNSHDVCGSGDHLRGHRLPWSQSVRVENLPQCQERLSTPTKL